MRRRKRLKKTGKHGRISGIRLPRKKKFEPVLQTESGIRVRSRYEVACADYLYKNDIRFQYEPLMLLGGRQFRPDFYLPDYNLFVEICGFGHMPFYRDRQLEKQNMYDKHKMKSVFIHYNGKGSLEKMLLEKLSDLGVRFTNP
jgi:DNA helicase-4